MYKEEWAISNASTLGSTFTLETGTNQRVVSQAAIGAATGSSVGIYRYNTGKTANDHQRIDASLITPTAGSLNTGVAVWLLARMPDTFATAGAPGTYVGASLNSAGGWTIQSINQSTPTSRASGSIGTLTLPGIFTLIAAGPLYVILWNGVPITSGSWTDTSNTVAGIGATKRNWGLLVQCSATNQQHPALDWSAAHDLGGRFFAAA